MKIEMLEKMNRWFYTTQNWKRQHSVFVIHSRLFRNLIMLRKKGNQNTATLKPPQKELRCKMVNKNAECLGIRTRVLT